MNISQVTSARARKAITFHCDDDDKLYLTTLTLSAEAGFHNGRVKNINKLLQVK